MSIEAILEHIGNQGILEREKVLEEAKLKAAGVLNEAKQKAKEVYRTIFDREKALYEKQKHTAVVNARLDSKKNMLAAKQELIEAAFETLALELDRAKLKKKQITPDKIHEVHAEVFFYLKQLRNKWEAEIAKILFYE
jgi:vacuolar-type H+-ATPase subunit E/Vma4